MSDYTPTTEQVEDAFSYDPEYEYHRPDDAGYHHRNRAAFRRWLAEHDRQTAERAWVEGAKWGALQVAGLPDTSLDYVQIKDGVNPYRQEQTDEN